MYIGKNIEIFAFEDLCLTNSKEEEIFGVIIDNKLSFNHCIKKIVEKLVRKSVLSPEYLGSLSMILN